MRGIHEGPNITDPIEPKHRAMLFVAGLVAILSCHAAMAGTRTDITEDPTPVSRVTVLIYGGVHDGPDGIDPLGAPTPRGSVDPGMTTMGRPATAEECKGDKVRAACYNLAAEAGKGCAILDIEPRESPDGKPECHCVMACMPLLKYLW